jgi:N-acetylglucosamine-6-phosphate deacetylase
LTSLESQPTKPSALVIHGGRIPARFFATRRTADGFTPAALRLENGVIATVDQEVLQPAGLDASGCVVLPGFIDVHIHGAGGHDVMDATPDALYAMARFMARFGVTGFLPTTASAPHAETLAAVQAVAQAQQTPPGARFDGARILGLHLEGPYLNPDYAGAQSPAAIRPPDLEEFRAYLDAGPLRLVTLAPELPGADTLIAEAQARGATVAIGHSGASYEQAIAALDAGVEQATHTYNAMTGLHHRQPGVVGATLADDRVFAQLIADGIHVHPAAMAVLARCKQPDKTVLITDAIRAMGLPPGHYEWGGHSVQVKDGACRLESGVLAGSVLTMDAGLRNFMAATNLPLGEAWVCTSHTPAHALRIGDQYGAIAPGFAADLVVLDEAL